MVIIKFCPGLVVIGGDSRSKDRGFESRCRILDGHGVFSHLFVVKIVMLFEKTKINEKEAGDGPFFLKKKEFCPVIATALPMRHNHCPEAILL